MICLYCGGEIPSKDFAVRTPGDNCFCFPCADKALDEWARLKEENNILKNAILNNSKVIVNTPGIPESEIIKILQEELVKQQQFFAAQTGQNDEIIKRLNERKREAYEENDQLREKMQKINDIAVNYQEDGPFIDTVTFAIISEIYDLSLGKE